MEKNTKKAKKNSANTLKNLKPWKKGDPSPNPNGRPLGSLNRKNIIQELLDIDAPESLLAEIRKINPNAKTLRCVRDVGTFNRMLKGNPKAMEIMYYYDIGKPEEKIQHSGEIQTGLPPELEAAVKILNERKRNK